MAELSYNDIQRAIRDGLRSIQENVQRLTTNVGTTSTTNADHIGYIEATVRDMQRTTQMMQSNLNQMKIKSSADPRLAQIAKDIYDLKVRFAAIEKFILQSGEYLQTKFEEDREDREYRNA